MRNALAKLKTALAAVAIALTTSTPVLAQNYDLDPLFDALRTAEGPAAEEIEARIWAEWSKSGSSAMDLLLERGRDALNAGNTNLAIEHFTALIDHAPDFAEAYNARATAYFQADLYGPSIEDIRQTLVRNPRHFGALSGLAAILEELGYDETALEASRAVEAIHPNRAGLREAIERLEQAVEGEAL
ncbi:MAG: hypothetical protein AAFR35_11635 [Pseudomonadota bacterium]